MHRPKDHRVYARRGQCERFHSPLRSDDKHFVDTDNTAAGSFSTLVALSWQAHVQLQHGIRDRMKVAPVAPKAPGAYSKVIATLARANSMAIKPETSFVMI
jgi:trehalose/maltose hydrolase-like predicted phosphorylase